MQTGAALNNATQTQPAVVRSGDLTLCDPGNPVGSQRSGQSGQFLDHGLMRLWPHQPADFLAITQEYQRGPKLYGKRAAQSTTGTIFDLDMAQRLALQRGVHQWLRRVADRAPVGAEVEHHGACHGIDVRAQRLIGKVRLGHSQIISC